MRIPITWMCHEQIMVVCWNRYADCTIIRSYSKCWHGNDLSWRIDINQASVQSASSNVQRNHLQNRIKIFHNIDSSKILPLDELEHEGVVPKGCQFSFSMCNPPFFANVEEVRAGNINKMDDPAAVSACTNLHIL